MRICWIYSGLQLYLADVGQGWFLNEIRVSHGSDVKLANGIAVKTPEAYVAVNYPDAEVRDGVYTVDAGLQGCFLVIGSLRRRRGNPSP